METIKKFTDKLSLIVKYFAFAAAFFKAIEFFHDEIKKIKLQRFRTNRRQQNDNQMTSTLFTSKLTASQLNKVNEVAQKLNFNPNWLLAVMYFETGKTFSPSITNPIGSVGLIQFTRDKSGVQYKTIGGKQYPLSVIKSMTFEQQMDLVYLYFIDVKSK